MNQDSTNENEKDVSGSSSSISSDLIRGHINTIILRTLYDGDKYGYEIINEIEEKSKGQYTLKQPTLYSALKRLESQDFLTSYWGGVSNGGRRKYFQITDKGRKVVEQNLAEWEYSRTVIDSLISERDYDFSNPPPSSSVDFNILKKSTTRVPVGKGDGEDYIELGEGEVGDAETEAKTPANAEQDVMDEPIVEEGQEAAAPLSGGHTEASAETPETVATADVSPESAAAVNEMPAPEQKEPAPPIPTETAETSAERDSRQVYSETASSAETVSRTIPESPLAPKEETPLTEEEKQRIHENYKVLIGDDTDATSYYYTHVAQRNREDRNTFDSSVFGNAPREEVPPQQPVQEPAYMQQPQDLYSQQPEYPPQPEYYYPPQESYDMQQPSEQPIAPPNDNETADLLYANRSPAERNYKSLLSRLYDNTVKPHEEEAQYQGPEEALPAEDYSAAEPPAASAPAEANANPVRTESEKRGTAASNIEFYDVEEKAENEGLRITTTNGSRTRTVSKIANNTFDKGKALFITAVYVFVIALAESIVNICLQGVMQSHTAYVVIPFVIDFVMLGVFLFLYLRGYGKNSRKSQSKSYISASLIIFVNLVLITCLVAYLISAATDTPLNFMIYAIFPCVYLFNIPLFAILYNYNSNKF